MSESLRHDFDNAADALMRAAEKLTATRRHRIAAVCEKLAAVVDLLRLETRGPDDD